MTKRFLSSGVCIAVLFCITGAGCTTVAPPPSLQLEEEAGSSRENSLQAQRPLEPEQTAGNTAVAQTEQQKAPDPLGASTVQTEQEQREAAVVQTEQQKASDPIGASTAQTKQEQRTELAAAQTEQEQREAAAAATGKNSFVVNDAAAFAQAIAALNSAETDGTYTITLTGSLTSEPLVFTGTATKTIILKGDENPRTIQNNGNGALFSVPKTITLVLDKNISLNGNRKDAALVAVDGGTFIMQAGSALYGAGKSAVSLHNRATFMMRGGEIKDNTAGSHGKGGGVFVADSAFTLEAGSISGNTEGISYGGGVFVTEGGTFTLQGGTIAANSAHEAGGGVYLESGTLTMEGGAINDNTASYGGGVSLDDGTFTMHGGTLNGNKGYRGGGVYLHNSAALLLAAGTISGNTASSSAFGGGGVYIHNQSSVMMAGGSISGNTAVSAGGGVYVDDRGTFTMEGGELSGNTAVSAGGGVYVAHKSGTLRKKSGTIDDTNAADAGKVVYISSSKQRNTTASPGVMLNSTIAGSSGGWE
ncbi:MAG: autotransporter adhesin family protein [Spirochaetaceae bacterium]|jgi:hypothetical protein|nr:autotransporter adhesin family protein [Spirochaetaceae bacterium]